MDPMTDALAATWTILHQVVGQAAPTPRVVAVLRDPAMLARWPLVVPGEHPTREPLRRGLAHLGDSTESQQEIDDDHFLLLRGPGAPVVEPWESVHRGRDHVLFDDHTMQVRQWYRRHRLQAPRLNVEPDDHLALELEFAAHLLVQAMETGAFAVEDADRYRSAHDAFCREHLLAWAPTCFERIVEHARTDFYRGVGWLGVDALQIADEVVGEA